MRITVIAVDQHEAALVRGTSALGWRGKFGCPLGVGDAVFIPAKGFEENLRAGNSISVETGYEQISQFQLISAEPECLQPLECPGDYLVRGRVVHAAATGPVKVSVRGLMFALERAELNGSEPKVGDSAQFRLHGLSLWDLNC